MENDGKILGVRISKELENAIKVHCLENKIENESELVRVAVAKYIFPDSSDTALQYVSLRDMQIKIQDLSDAVHIILEYMKSMHRHLLIYKNNIPDNLLNSAVEGAQKSYRDFFKDFTDGLKNDDPPFIERMLHRWYDDGRETNE